MPDIRNLRLQELYTKLSLNWTQCSNLGALPTDPINLVSCLYNRSNAAYDNSDGQSSFKVPGLIIVVSPLSIGVVKGGGAVAPPTFSKGGLSHRYYTKPGLETAVKHHVTRDILVWRENYSQFFCVKMADNSKLYLCTGALRPGSRLLWLFST